MREHPENSHVYSTLAKPNFFIDGHRLPTFSSQSFVSFIHVYVINTVDTAEMECKPE